MKSKHDFKYTDDYDEYLRAYFAAMSLQGLLTNMNNTDWVRAVATTANMAGQKTGEMIATISVEYADKLIHALNQPNNTEK